MALAETIGRVQAIMGGISRRRATTIIRTELGRAFATASQTRAEEAQQSVPGLKKQWRRSGKIHSRRKHDLTDGQVRPVDQPFILGTGRVIEGQESGGIRIRHPHDPAAPPSETINCDCISLPYMDSWDGAGLLENPGKKPFSAKEIRLNPVKQELAEPGPTLGEILDARNNALRSPKSRRVLWNTEKALQPDVNERSVVIDSRGEILLEKEGEPESIRFTLDELALMRDSIVTHTHNVISSFSPADIGLAATHGLAEIRAVDRIFSYSMRPPREGWNREWFETIARPALEKQMEQRLRAGYGEGYAVVLSATPPPLGTSFPFARAVPLRDDSTGSAKRSAWVLPSGHVSPRPTRDYRPRRSLLPWPTAVEREFQKALDDGLIDHRQFDQNIWDEVWHRVAQEIGVTYRRRKRRK